MSDPSFTTRRRFLASAGAMVSAGGISSVMGEDRASASADENPGAGHSDSFDANRFILKSQPLPGPRVILPTDALPPPAGPKKRIAAITTTYFKYSHADDIITKFIEGYSIVGRTHLPHCQVVGLYIEQFPDTDIGRGMAARYRVPLFDSPAGALTRGGHQLAVDGVLLIGEHGDYPRNEKGQQLYPRRRLLQQIVNVFRASGKSVPVFNDKHLSYSWENADWMYRQSRELGFAMMAGSSVPVTWRQPPLAFRPGIRLDAALAVGYAGIESYGFHTLELLQTFVERRQGGETGVKAVQTLEGDAAWTAAQDARWSTELLEAALGTVEGQSQKPSGLENLRQSDPRAVVFLVEYRDGFQAAAYLSRGLVSEFCFAAKVHGQSRPVATQCILPKPQRDHFSFLCNHIEVMFRTGQPSYPVERTYLVSGVLAALMDSYAAGGKRTETPHLGSLAYTPKDEVAIR